MRRIDTRKTLLALALIALQTAASADPAHDGSQSKAGSKSSVLSLSDIHFDPFYDPAVFQSLVQSDAQDWERIFRRSTVTDPSKYGADTNFPLLSSALAEARLAVPFPDMIIISGDLLAHDFVSTFATAYGSNDPKALQSFVDKRLYF